MNSVRSSFRTIRRFNDRFLLQVLTSSKTRVRRCTEIVEPVVVFQRVAPRSKEGQHYQAKRHCDGHFKKDYHAVLSDFGFGESSSGV